MVHKEKRLILSCIVSISLWIGSAVAALPELDRGVVSQFGQGNVELWGQGDYFHPDLDIFDFREKANTRSSLDEAVTLNAGIKFAFFDRLNLRYRFSHTTAEITRPTEPTHLESEMDGHDVLLQVGLINHPVFRLAGELGYVRHLGDPTVIRRFEFGGVVFNQDISLLDPETGELLPIATLNGDGQGYSLGLRAAIPLSHDLNLMVGLRRQEFEIDASVDSVLFEIEDPFFLGLEFNGRRIGDLIDDFRATLPQDSPWEERHWVLEAGFDWRINKYFGTAWQVSHFEIDRDDYEPNPNKQDYDSNTVLEGYLFWFPFKHLSVYVRGLATTNYLLGVEPLLYNRRTNHLFDNPYGSISAGIAIAF